MIFWTNSRCLNHYLLSLAVRKNSVARSSPSSVLKITRWSKQTLGTAGHGKVLVVDGGGSLRCALLGDILGAMAVQNGWQGVLINGCVRDVEILKGMDLGVRCSQLSPAQIQ